MIIFGCIVLIQNKTKLSWKCLAKQSLSIRSSVLFCLLFGNRKMQFLSFCSGTFTSALHNLTHSLGGSGLPAMWHCCSLLKFQDPERVLFV